MSVWTTQDETLSEEDLRAWARQIAAAAPAEPHRHGPFYFSAVERAKITGEKLLCPACGAQVSIPPDA